jgi:inhibitor of cysteine peptidase
MGMRLDSGRVRRYIALVVLSAIVVAAVFTTYMGLRYSPPDSSKGSWTTSWASGGGSSYGYVSPGANLSSVAGAFRSFSSYDEIRRYLSSISEAVEPLIPGASPEVLPTIPIPRITPVSLVSSSAGTPAFSTTNVQVRGVDELDIVKTDGRLLVISSYGKVYIVDALGRRLLSIIEINGSSRGAFLWGDMLAVIAGDRWAIYRDVAMPAIYPIIYGSNTSIYIYNISNPSKPVLRERISYSGGLVGARMINGTVYIVLSSPASPEIIPLVNGAPLRPSQIFLVDQRPSRFVTVASIDLYSGARSEISLLTSTTTWIYMSPSKLCIASYIYPYDLASGKAVEILSSLLPHDIGSRMLDEMSRGNISGALGIATSYLSALERGEALSIISNASARLSTYVLRDMTRIHILDVKGISIGYRGSVDVPGRILDQFSMEEHRGYLILATTASNLSPRLIYTMPSIISPSIQGGGGNITVRIVECVDSRCSDRYISLPAYAERLAPRIWISVSLAVLGETYNNVYIVSPENMKIVGSLEGLARGERIYAARLVGDIFYLVTYRQVDPLYAIDVRDPGKPEVLGYIKIPGFSEYLHPLQGNMLLGVGLEDRDLKISLFNISNPRNIAEISFLKIEGATTPVLLDHHAFTIHPEKGLIMIPIAIVKVSGNTMGIAVISYGADGVRLQRILEHREAMRSIYIGETIYTISSNMVKLFSINTLQEIANIPLN